MRIQGDFGMMQAAQHNVQQALAQVQQESDTWQRAIHQLAPDLADGTGTASNELHAAWNQMNTAHQAMLDAFRNAIGNAHNELNTAVVTSASRLRNISI